MLVLLARKEAWRLKRGSGGDRNSKAGQYSSAKVHKTLKVNQDGSYALESLDGLNPEEISGF